MNLYVNQSIHINLIRIGVIANSSILQIGSTGIAKPVSKIYSPESIQKDKKYKVPFKVLEF